MSTPKPGPYERRWRKLRRQVNKVWADEDPPTLVGGAPPLDLWAVRQPLPAPVDVEQQRSFDFAQRIGAVMVARGASVDDAEASVRAAALAMGLRNPEVDVTYNSVVLSVRPDPGRPPLTSVGVMHQRNDDYSRIAATHELLLTLTAGKMTRSEAFERLEQIEQRQHPYGQNVLTLARGALAGAIVAQLGGNWAAILVVFFVAMLIDSIGRWLSRHRVPSFYLSVIGGLLATLTAAASTALGAQQTPSLVVAGSIVALLPGNTFVNGVRDALSGYFVTANARMLEVVVVVAGLVGGVSLGLVVSKSLDIDMSVIPYGFGLDDLGVRLASAAVAAAAAAIIYYIPLRLLPTAVLSGAFGMLVLVVAQELNPGGVVTYPLAAFAIGLVGYALANLQRSLPMMVVVPGILALLPGLTIYTGLLELSAGQAFDGIVHLAEAGARGLAIAAGVLVAELIGQPVRRRMTRRSRPDPT